MAGAIERRRQVVTALCVGITALLIAAGCTGGTSHDESSAPGNLVDPAALEGDYSLVVDGTRHLVNGVHLPNGVATTSIWNIEPCGAGCSRVKSSMGWSADLHLEAGAWRGGRTLTMDCVGTPAPATVTYTLDAKTLTGRTVNTLRCEGQAPIVVDAPAVLTKN